MKKVRKDKREFIRRQVIRKARYEVNQRILGKIALRNMSPIKIKEKRNKAFLNSPNKGKHETFIAQSTFSLLEDPSSVNSLINEAGESLARNIPVKFDLSKVVVMGPETLVYYCALFNDSKYSKGNVILGNLPNDMKLQKMFKQSNFLSFVKSKILYQADPNDIEDGIMHRVSRIKVEPVIAGETVRKAIKYTYNCDDISKQKIYPILIECMGNTFNHANFADKSETYNWWLLAYKEPETKITKFCFLDLGIGIFGSLNKKQKDHQVFGWLVGKIFPDNNGKTLKEIFKGDHKSSTDESGRGLGIHNIYSTVRNNPYINNFTMISNDIIAKIEYNHDAIISKLQDSFNGTLYYWEILPKK